MRTSALAIATGLALGASLAPPVSAQESEDQRLGTVHFATSCNEDAQRRFNRGMRYQHSFWYRQAREIFEGALNSDILIDFLKRLIRDAAARFA